MKRYLMIFGILSVSVGAFSQQLNRTFQYYDRTPLLLGQSTLERLKEEPFTEWFSESYDEYEVSDVVTDIQLPDSITIFMGTWCGDSQREVPRFIKILEEIDFDFSKLKIICLNSSFQNYKQAPEREEKGVDVHRVPTFIFQNADGSEIGRIVEEPVVSLEVDMETVLAEEPYATAYPVVQNLIKKFKESNVDELRKQKKKLIEEYKIISTKEAELNTYGYVLWSSFQLKRAELVFELNHQLYPESARLAGTLATFKSNIGKQKEAQKYLSKGLAMEPDNDRLLDIKKNFESLN